MGLNCPVCTRQVSLRQEREGTRRVRTSPMLDESTLLVVPELPQVVWELLKEVSEDVLRIFLWDEEDQFEARQSHSM